VSPETGSSASEPGEGRRDEILRKAALLFLESGYRGASMGAIAKRVGIAKPTLYHYWPSKEDILYEIHKQFIQPLLDQQRSYAERDLRPDDQLRRCVQDMMESLNDDPGYVRSFIEHGRELSAERSREVRQIGREHRELIEQAIEQGIEQGMFRKVSPTIAAYALLGVASWAAFWFQPGGPLNAERVAEELSDIVLNGLRTQA
jgi:TetR/AcrR family transcriptional regulator, cholesterol catabolism regulator